jgi:acyl-CoA synthetase (AMP-forming)/AMP-acid ligase II/thioesterase domain-containing protein
MAPSKTDIAHVVAAKYPFDNIVAALRHAATHTNEGIIAYIPNSIPNSSPPQTLSYKELLHQAETNATRLLQHGLCRPRSIVLTHFESAFDSIVWYWSILLAGGIPAVIGPGMFSQNPADRQKHLRHLSETLKASICLTRSALLGPFEEQTADARIEARTVDEILALPVEESAVEAPLPAFHPSPTDILALMLTSGSSGNAKAVPLTHQQLLAAFRGKSAVANLRFPRSPFLSWVHMDHVANLVHCHIFAIVSGISQIQVPAADLLVNPAQLLNLISRHRVSRTFMPNFLCAKLRRQLESGSPEYTLDSHLNLETLYVDTGGEANVTKVCVALQALLSRYGAPDDVFKPSFGMTETAAGCIFNSRCPSYDDAEHHEFACLGRPMPGVRMRVTRLDNPSEETAPGERGSLEVTGEVVFTGNYNNPAATAEAFTSDGWFRTGDLAFMDSNGNLHLDGRTKEMININGVKYLPYELDAALEQAEIPGTTPSYFCTFSSRDGSMDTEGVVVLYLPSYGESDDDARFNTQSSIIRVVALHTRSRPRVVPLRLEDMPKSTLGKLSRAKLKTAFEEGRFAAQEQTNNEAIKRYQQKTRGSPETPEEALILDIIKQQLELRPEDEDFGVNDSILSIGATSMDLVAIIHRANKRLQPFQPLRLTDILKDPTAKGLALAASATAPLQETQTSTHVYNPVVTLQPHGTKTPLWLVHPGVGEVLVFVNLAHHIKDRPVYAFRAKGFNAAAGLPEPPFTSLDELFTTYRDAIKQRQPHGPYAIAGYSFGGMVAFEVSKLLEQAGDEVRYCGSWNLPPHIKSRMRELVWEECVIHLFYFVGLMTEEAAYTHKPALQELNRENRRLDAIRYLRRHCDAARWDELGLSEEYYLLWVDLASNMQSLAVEYEPRGAVKCMDVFVADPLSHVAKDRRDWVEGRLSAWRGFVREGVRFHDVQGAHYTMLNREYVEKFAATLRAVLRDRGV